MPVQFVFLSKRDYESSVRKLELEIAFHLSIRLAVVLMKNFQFRRHRIDQGVSGVEDIAVGEDEVTVTCVCQ